MGEVPYSFQLLEVKSRKVSISLATMDAVSWYSEFHSRIHWVVICELACSSFRRTIRSEIRTSWHLMPCVRHLNVWVESYAPSMTMGKWYLQTNATKEKTISISCLSGSKISSTWAVQISPQTWLSKLPQISSNKWVNHSQCQPTCSTMQQESNRSRRRPENATKLTYNSVVVKSPCHISISKSSPQCSHRIKKTYKCSSKSFFKINDEKFHF